MIEDELKAKGEKIGAEIQAAEGRFRKAAAEAEQLLADANRTVSDMIFSIYMDGNDTKALSRHLLQVEQARTLVEYKDATVARFQREYRQKAFCHIKRAAKIREERAAMLPWRATLEADPKNPHAREWLRIYADKIGDGTTRDEVEAFIAALPV